MKVFIDEHDETGRRTGSRKKVECSLVKKTNSHFYVRLGNGDVIKRKMQRDLPEGEVIK